MDNRNLETDISASKDLQEMTNPQVLDYLVLTHHEFTRDIMNEIARLLENDRVYQPETQEVLVEVRKQWPEFHIKMAEHLEHEEQILFPSIESSINMQGSNEPAENTSMQTTVLSLIKEHDHHEDELHGIRILIEKLQMESSSDPVIHQLCDKICQLDADLREHMQIESELLFPRVLKALSLSSAV